MIEWRSLLRRLSRPSSRLLGSAKRALLFVATWFIKQTMCAMSKCRTRRWRFRMALVYEHLNVEREMNLGEILVEDLMEMDLWINQQLRISMLVGWTQQL